jgi:hypothetical protein
LNTFHFVPDFFSGDEIGVEKNGQVADAAGIGLEVKRPLNDP